MFLSVAKDLLTFIGNLQLFDLFGIKGHPIALGKVVCTGIPSGLFVTLFLDLSYFVILFLDLFQYITIFLLYLLTYALEVSKVIQY